MGYKSKRKKYKCVKLKMKYINLVKNDLTRAIAFGRGPISSETYKIIDSRHLKFNNVQRSFPINLISDCINNQMCLLIDSFGSTSQEKDACMVCQARPSTDQCCGEDLVYCFMENIRTDRAATLSMFKNNPILLKACFAKAETLASNSNGGEARQLAIDYMISLCTNTPELVYSLIAMYGCLRKDMSRHRTPTANTVETLDDSQPSCISRLDIETKGSVVTGLNIETNTQFLHICYNTGYNISKCRDGHIEVSISRITDQHRLLISIKRSDSLTYVTVEREKDHDFRRDLSSLM